MSFHSVQSVRFNNQLANPPYVAPPMTYSMSGTASGSSSASATISRKVVASGNTTGASTASATIRRTRPFAGSSAGSSSTSANNTRRRLYTASSAGLSSISGGFVYQTANSRIPVVSLSATGKDVTVSWAAIPFATGYAILRNGVGLTTTTNTSIISNVPNDGDWTFQVASQQSGGNYSAYSAVQTISIHTIFLSIPQVTYLAGANKVSISWATVPSATGYDIRRDGAIINSTVSTTYTDPIVPDGTYAYSVRAKETYGGYSAWSPNYSILVDRYDITTRPSLAREPAADTTLGRAPLADTRKIFTP